jgi:hypothetical protein
MVGGESAAASVVSKALEQFVAPSHEPRTVTLAASRVPEAWLPTITSVRFVRLDDEAMASHYRRCGMFLWVKIDRAKNRLIVTVGEGTKCLNGGRRLQFLRRKNGWQLENSGTGAGFVGGTDHCQCS